MIRHTLKNNDKFNLKIGIPGTLKITGGADSPEIIINASRHDERRMDFKIKENRQGSHVRLRDRYQGKNGKMNCDIIVHLPHNPLECLSLNTVCNEVDIENLTIHKLDINNVKGVFTVGRDIYMDHLHLNLVTCKSEINLGNKLQTAKIKAIQSKTRINADGFDGICNINVIGAEARVNDVTVHNGCINIGSSKDGRIISCEIVSGRFFIDGISA